ncbi:hypothetical protein TWF481_008888 [Arthrobotrys musiformis]|uniref:F-box domain-containing protein n=1 Tax=Arthrobotrys musiformis TaxID=47236 RepID=A0AAV9WAH0_9PEZI
MASTSRALKWAGRKLGDGTSDTTNTAGKKPPLTLETLPYDILISICEYIAPEDGPWPCQDETCSICASQHIVMREKVSTVERIRQQISSIRLTRPSAMNPLPNTNYYAAFSQTSKYLREIAIPFVFRAMRIAPRTGEEYMRLGRELLLMEGKGIFESVRKLSIVFSPDIYLDENLCLRNEFPVFKQSDMLISSMEIILRNITKLDTLLCKIDFVKENFRLNSLPLTKERRIPVGSLMISYGCGWLLPHLEPRRLMIRKGNEETWYHIVRAETEVARRSTLKIRTESLRLRGIDHPERDTRAVRFYKDLKTCANFLTELRIFTYIVDNNGIKDLLQCVPYLERLHLENHWHSWSRPDRLTFFDLSVTLSCLHSLVYLHIWNDSDSAREYDIRDENIHASFARNCKSLQELVLGIDENTAICKIMRDESGDLIPEKTQLRAKDEPDKRVFFRPSPHQGRNFVKSFLNE